MKNYEVGYGKPPLATRFRKGVCPNPAGRGRKHKSSELSQIEQILYKPVHPTGNRRREKLTHAEIIVRKLIFSALKGKPYESLQLLKLYKHTAASPNEELIIHVKGGCPGLFDKWRRVA